MMLADIFLPVRWVMALAGLGFLEAWLRWWVGEVAMEGSENYLLHVQTMRLQSANSSK